jgi:3-oxoacyl-[acyl-carrier protein] reductase
MAGWALIGGGTGGIGRAVCRALAEDGWDVAVGYHHNETAANDAAAEIRALGARAKVVEMDLRDAETTAVAVEQVAGDGGLGAVVYAAGPSIRFAYISELEASELGAVLGLDVQGCFNLVRPALAHLRATQGAVLALTTQALARYAKRDLLSTVPKAGVEAIIKGVAVEEGRYGVRANAVGVGMVEGEGSWEAMLETGQYTEAVLETARAGIPLKRFGTSRDIAVAVRFLLSQDATWITGQTLYVDGGYSTP